MPLRKHFDESKHKRGPKGSSMGGKFVSKAVGSEAAGGDDFALFSEREEQLSSIKGEIEKAQKSYEAGANSSGLTKASHIFSRLETLSASFEFGDAEESQFSNFRDAAEKYLARSEEFEMAGNTWKLNQSLGAAIQHLANMHSILEESM
jgi:hypothetical protein